MIPLAGLLRWVRLFLARRARAALAAGLIGALTVTACSVEVPETVSVTTTITGIVSAPAGDSDQFASAAPGGIFQRLASVFVKPLAADINGLEPIGGATVELVRLDSAGIVLSVVDSVESEPNGAYTFSNSPSPDSTLAVRVVGETETMRAIVTGAQVDISPISEVVTGTIVDALASAAVLENFELEEIDALTVLVQGMDIDVSGQTFADAVTAIQGASTPILPAIASGYSAAGMVDVLHTKGYGAVELASVLRDPFITPSNSGIEARTRDGGWGFGIDDWINDGSLFENAVRHDLEAVAAPTNSAVGVSGLPHVVTAAGQVIVGGAGGGAVAGAVTSDGSVMAYPVSEAAAGALGRGMRLAITKPNSLVLDNTLLDAAGGAGTTYHLIQLREQVSGPISSAGVNAVQATTVTGPLTFNSDAETTLNGSVYAGMDSGIDALATSPLTVDLDGYGVTPGPAGSDSLAGHYRVFPDGGLLLRESDGAFLATGIATADGRLLAFSGSSDPFATELDVLANDADAAGDVLTIVDVTQPPNGTVEINADGTRLLYRPKGNDTSPESFSYTVRDAAGQTADGSVDVSLVDVNAAPTGNADSFIVNTASTDVVLDVLANDSDATGDTLTIVSVDTPPSNGVATTDGDTISYTPNAAYTGPDNLTYTAEDADGLSTGPVTVTLTVAADAAPTGNPDSFTVNAGSTDVVLDVLANDLDATGDTLAIASVDTSLSNGIVVINAAGTSLLYTPGASGADSFTYSLEGVAVPVDVDVNVVATNGPPAAGADSFEINVNNQAERLLAVGVRQASSMANAIVSGTYNAVQHGTYFAEVGAPPTSATVDAGFKYGRLTFDDQGNVSGSLLRQRARLDIAVAKTGGSDALTALPTPQTPEAPIGSYTVAGDGAMTLSLTIGAETVTGTGAVSEDGELIVLAIESSEPDVSDGRGLLFLVRQP